MYCTKCGKKLEEGEICSCTQRRAARDAQIPHMRNEQRRSVISEKIAENGKNAEWAKEKGTQAAGIAQDIFRQIFQIIRKPVSKTAEMAAGNSRMEGFRLLIAKAAVFVVITCILISRLNRQLGGWAEIPYMSMCFLTLVLTLGLDWIEVLFLGIFSKAFKGVFSRNAMYAVVGTRTVYELVTLIVAAVLSMCSQFTAILTGGLLLVLTFYVEAAAYRATVDMNEDKKVFAFFIAKICTLVAALILIFLLGQDMINSLSDLSYYLNY